MYKFFFILALVFVILSIISYCLSRVNYDNNGFDKDVNDAIKELVEQVITVKYKTHSQETMKDIFTDELLKNINNYWPDFFSKKQIYFISNNYMQTMHKIATENQWYLTIGIREGLFFGEDYLIQIGIIQKEEDGSYVIFFIGKDI
jgi:hypothetical protein